MFIQDYYKDIILASSSKEEACAQLISAGADSSKVREYVDHWWGMQFNSFENKQVEPQNPILIGLLIFNKYNPDFQMDAQHDQVWVGPEFIDVSEEDENKLKASDWFICDETNTWSHFT